MANANRNFRGPLAALATIVVAASTTKSMAAQSGNATPLDRLRAAAAQDMEARGLLSDPLASNHWSRWQVKVVDTVSRPDAPPLVRLILGEDAYLGLVSDSVAYRLGGWEHPDLAAADSVMRALPQCSVSFRARARCLAVADDPFGALQFVFAVDTVADPSAAALRRAWNRANQAWWPHDSVRTDSGVTMVVVTTWSRTISYDSAWVAIAYTFVFRDDRLIDWASRMGIERFAP